MITIVLSRYSIRRTVTHAMIGLRLDRSLQTHRLADTLFMTLSYL